MSKNFRPTKYSGEKFRIHEIPRRKNFGPTKYQRDKNLDPRNTHEKTFRIHEGTMAQDPRDPRWHDTHGI